MSRGFVKESDQEELPIVPPRADLPLGMVNYVTEIGYAELLAERDKMIYERDNLLISDENENRITVNFINAKLQLLSNRISTAKIVNLSNSQKIKFVSVLKFSLQLIRIPTFKTIKLLVSTRQILQKEK